MMSVKCSFITRRGVACIRTATCDDRCECHTPEEMKRQTAIRAARQEEILLTGGKKRVDAAELVKKMELAIENLSMREIKTCIGASVEAGRVFEEITNSSKTIFQQAKRAWHQPQLESLTMLVSDLIKESDTCILELGAGKGLLGAMSSLITSVPTIVLDRREGGTGAAQASGRIHADLADISSFSEILPSNKSHKCLVIAKHFCANATDLAVKKISSSLDVVSAVLLAPCCHPKMTFEDYIGRQWLSDLGFDKNDFSAMLQLIELSRTRSSNSHVRTCRNITSDSLAGLKNCFFHPARLARRLIEEGRIHHIETAMNAQGVPGQLSLVEYSHHCTTPDGLCIVGRVGERKEIVQRGISPTVYGDEGVLLHLSCESVADLPRRVVEYLLEKRSREKLFVFNQVWIADSRNRERITSDRATTELVVLHGDVPSLINAITSDQLLSRVVDKAFPFYECIDSLSEISNLTNNSNVHRVYALPKALESELVLSNTVTQFHATKFDTTLSVLEWCLEGYKTPKYLVSVMSTSDWDPRRWPSLPSLPPSDRFESRLREAAIRGLLSINSYKALWIVRSTDATFDDVDRIKKILNFNNDFPTHCVTTNTTASLSTVDGLSPSSGNLFLLDLPSFICNDILSVIRALPPSHGGFLLAAGKICPPARRNNPNFVKNTLASIAAEMQGVVRDFEIRHLVSDREHERTFTGICG